MEGVVIDTNVFVAAGFNARSASERILEFRPSVGISSLISFGQKASLPAVSTPATLSSLKIRTIVNSRRSAQQPKFHSLPMTTISWRIEI